MYSCGPPHMDVQKQDDQHELTYSNYVKTCRSRWMIGRSGERGSGISVLAARHDDDDDDDCQTLQYLNSVTPPKIKVMKTKVIYIYIFVMKTKVLYYIYIYICVLIF